MTRRIPRRTEGQTRLCRPKPGVEWPVRSAESARTGRGNTWRERMESNRLRTGVVLQFAKRRAAHGSGPDLLGAQDAPLHIGAQVFTPDALTVRRGRLFDRRAVLGRDLAVGVEPGPDAGTVPESKDGRQGCLTADDLSCASKRLLLGGDDDVHGEVYAAYTSRVNASQTLGARSAYLPGMDKNANDKSALGPRLKAARVSAGFTQDAAAERLGLKKATISSWETSRNVPDSLMLGRIARLYGTTTDALLWDAPYTSDASAVAAEFQAMSEDRRRVFLAMWKAYVGSADTPSAAPAESGYKLPTPLSDAAEAPTPKRKSA